MEKTDKVPVLKLGYWPLRGRAQVARLVLEYLRVPYQEIHFSNNQEWEEYKAAHQDKHPLLELPFLIDGDVVITEAVPICNYVVKRSKQKDLLGRNIRDIATLDMYTWSIDNLGIAMVQLCWMPGKSERIEEVKDRFWQTNVKEKLDRLQNFAASKPWMMGYLSLFDFSIYELIHYITIIFPRQIKDYSKLREIEEKIGNLPEIKAYESSKRAVKIYLPSRQQKKSK